MASQKSENRDRQVEWRMQQEADGLVQVRVWVPANRQADVKEFARKIRESDTSTPSTGKQKYQAKKIAKELSIGLPSEEIFNDKYRLDVWMTAVQCLECEIELPKIPHGRPASQSQIDLTEKMAAQLNVEPPSHFYNGHLSLRGWISKAKSLGAKA